MKDGAADIVWAATCPRQSYWRILSRQKTDSMVMTNIALLVRARAWYFPKNAVAVRQHLAPVTPQSWPKNSRLSFPK